MTQFSFSRVECFKSCPYKYKLRYKDNLRAFENDDPICPLHIGVGLHTGVEQGVDIGVQTYFNKYPIINDLHINEEMKLRSLVPKVQDLLPNDCEFEVELNCDDFVGYIDLLVKVGEHEYEIWDFKYSNNIDHYKASAQLHIYKYFFEKLNPGSTVTKLGFIFVPKTFIRQKKTEDLSQFRTRLSETLLSMQPNKVEIKFQFEKVAEYLLDIKHICEATEFEKKESRLCDFCEYKEFCKNGDTTMLLPKPEVRTLTSSGKKKLWIYGSPYCGKTTLADQFPEPLFLNTDGNVNSFTHSFINIGDTYNGKLPVFAWETFRDAINELAKGSDYKTVVVDLIDDAYEHCRKWCYKQMGIKHESENSFTAWDFVRNEFLSTIKKLATLNYNIVLISHEDMSKDITKQSGDKITAIKPNIPEKVAHKIAGLVDATVRITVDDDVRYLDFRNNNVIFGGGRLGIEVYNKEAKFPCTFESIQTVYDNYFKNKAIVEEEPKPIPQEEPKVEEVKTEAPAVETTTEEAPRRRRRVTETAAEPNINDSEVPF